MKVELDIEALKEFLYFLPGTRYGYWLATEDGNLIIRKRDVWGVEEKTIGKAIED